MISKVLYTYHCIFNLFYIEMIKYKIFIFFHLIILFFACSNHKGESNKKTFNEIFSLEKEFTFKGTQNFPLFSIASISIDGDNFYIADNKNSTIHHFKNGTQINVWGGHGRGPGEFLDLSWIENYNGRLFALDGQGSYRVKIFNLEGKSIDTFPIKSSGPFSQNYILKVDSGKNLFISTTAVNCKNDPKKVCTLLIEDLEGNVINTFAPTDEVAPNAIGVPFLSVRVGENFFLTHIFGSNFTRYDISGKKMDQFSLDVSPFTNFLEVNDMPKDVYQQALELNRSSYTLISELHSLNDKIFVQYLRKGQNYNNHKKRFIDIFNSKGELIIFGIENNLRLVKINDGHAYFLNNDLDYEFGAFILSKYKIDI